MALGVTAFVTYRAYSVSRQEKAIVERVLRQQVQFASFQLRNNLTQSAFGCLAMWFSPVTAGTNGASVGAPMLHECGNTGTARFEIDFVKHEAKSLGAEPVPATLLRWLQDTIPQHPAADYHNGWKIALLANPHLQSNELVAYALYVQQGRARRATGFIARSTSAYMLRQVLTMSVLLPEQYSKNLPNEELLNTSLVPAFAANARPDDDLFSTSRTLDAAFGGMVLDVHLADPAVKNILPDGKIPRDRGFELLSLFLLALGLVAAALLLLRRESQLATERAGFVSSVSHELRTPLAQIRMFAEMLLLGRVRSERERQRSLEIIDKEARRLSHLVDNVLQVARSERGAVRLNPEELRLASVLRETVEGFMVLSEARNLEFRMELQDDLVVSADPEAVRQIVLNLLDNAAKYGPAGQRVVVGFALFKDAARLWVDDEGPGVPVRERERVFETFYRAKRDLDSSTAGSGIGLGVVRELVTLHGGSAWIEDAPQGGARVVVEFPGAYRTTERTAVDWAVA